MKMYEIAVTSAESVSDRRMSSNGYFLSVISALFAALALYPAFASLPAEQARPIVRALAGLVLIVSIGWMISIRSYRTLNRAKFSVICEMEQALPALPYSAEWKRLKLYVPLSYLEFLVPLLIGVWSLYIVYGTT